MTHRGPFQPLPFCDSVITGEVDIWPKQARLPIWEEKHSILSPCCWFFNRSPAFTSLDSALLQPVLLLLSQGHSRRTWPQACVGPAPLCQYSSSITHFLYCFWKQPKSRQVQGHISAMAPVYMNHTDELASRTAV